MRLALIIVCAGLALTGNQATGARHALLIGCSDYKSQPDLFGCGNDVKLLRELLSTPRFGFANSDLTVLSDTDPTTKKPTYKNIVGAFEKIVDGDWAEDADEDMLLVYMAGHGGQRSSDQEKDGKDEFFLPVDEADVILDDQVGQWLTQLNQRGIHVWIVFDSCFSGTMTRGGETKETVRGIPSKGTDLVRSNESVGWELPEASTGSNASCVAFYACQAFETAIEDRTLDIHNGKPNPHGLFSYCLLQSLGNESSGQSRMTYHDLHRRIIDQYRRLGRTWPTPFCEGQLDQEVLGFASWPKSNPLHISNDGKAIELVGGQLAGVSKNAIVAVYDPHDREQTMPIAYLQAHDVTATNARGRSVAYGDIRQPVEISELTNYSTCRVVSHEIGELRVALSVLSAPGQARVVEALKVKAAEPTSIFQLSDIASSQGWSLVVDPMRQRETLLLPNSLALTADEKLGFTDAELLAHPHVKYNATLTTKELVEVVERDLRRIYSCRNLERLASAYGENSIVDHEIKLKMTKVGGTLDTTEVKAGDKLRFDIVNEGATGCAYAVFFTTGRFKIKHEGAGFLKPRASIFRPTKEHLFDVTVNAKMVGRNGLVLIGIPQEGKVKHQLNLSGIAQSGLGAQSSEKRGFHPTTKFEEQLFKAMLGNQTFRAGNTGDTSPQMSIISWVISK